MSDNDLIRRGDALECFMGLDRIGDIMDAITALPAVTVGVPEATVHRAVLDWIRDDAGAAVKMSMTPDRANALTARIMAALGVTPAPDLSDPVTVHANMLRGSIAKPTVEQIVHLYGREAFQSMIDVAIAEALEGACLAVSEHADWPEDEHGRTEQVDLFARVINAIREITPAVTPAPDVAAIREAALREAECQAAGRCIAEGKP